MLTATYLQPVVFFLRWWWLTNSLTTVPPQTAKDGKAEIAICVDPDGTPMELIQVHLGK